MYVTKLDLKEYLRIDGEDDDGLFDTLLKAAQARVDQICQRTFEASADSIRFFDAYEVVAGHTLFFKEDLAAITRLENNGAVVPSTGYTLLPRNGPKPYYGLKLTKGRFEPGSTPEDAIKITGKWAYSETAPFDIVQACKRLAGFYFREKDSQVFEVIGPSDQANITLPQTEPAAVKAILRPYIKPPSHIR